MHREATAASECVFVLEEVLSQPTALLGYVTWGFSGILLNRLLDNCRFSARSPVARLSGPGGRRDDYFLNQFCFSFIYFSCCCVVVLFSLLVFMLFI